MRSNDTALVWFITGCSSGLGRTLTDELLARGDKVIATTRASSFASLESLKLNPNCRVLELDATASAERIGHVAEVAIAIWGKVDVVVNNAGYGFVGVLEETGVEGMLQQLPANLFGPINVTNAFLPHMRTRKSGTILFVGSRTAWHDRIPMAGYYAASKASLRSISQAYAMELAPFNIRTLLIEPGGMQTQNWANNTRGDDLAFKLDSKIHPSVKPTSTSSAVFTTPNPFATAPIKDIFDYTPLKERAYAFMDDRRDSQPSSAVKVAHVLVDVVRGEGVAFNAQGQLRPWPEWLIVGEDANEDVREKCRRAIELLDEWQDVVLGVGLDPGEGRR